MDRQSLSTWSSMNLARDLGMDWGEVTATHTNLLAIAEAVRGAGVPLHIERVTQQRERSLGADWEFWLQAATGAALGYSIQAKKVYPRASGFGYPHLSHRGERANEKQYQTLIRHAQSVGSLPFHVFYNGWPLPNRLLSFRDARRAEYFGCAAVSSYDVRSIYGSTKRLKANVENFVDVSMPWSDLFRAGPDARRGGGGSSPNHGPKPHPSAPRPVKLTERGLQRLLDRHSSHLTQSATLGNSLPDYILKAQQLPADQLPDAPDLPEFAIIVSAG
jgi:hypothetical protein